MKKLILSSLTVLSLGFFAVNLEQAQSQTMTCSFSGQISGSSHRSETLKRTINGVSLPTIVNSSNDSYNNVISPTNCSQTGSNINLSVPQWNNPNPPSAQIHNFGNPSFVNPSLNISDFNKRFRGR